MSSSTDSNERDGVETTGPKTENNFLIVGLGGSAGAITAFKEFFQNVPPQSGMAYVVILHLSPEHESHLAEILQQSTVMPVAQVREAVRVEPNQVYVIPPDKSLSMQGGLLMVSDRAGYEERRAPVDIFFRTLADSNDSRAVSVIVSGTGANGSMGLKRVKERGGLVLTQTPSEAEFDEMPRNSIATGFVDHVLPVAEIPGKIIAYRDQLGSIHIAEDADERAEADERALVEIFTQLRVRTGHDFTNYKRASVLRRIERRMGIHQLAALTAYASYMREHREEARALLKDLLISVTNFFRDREAFWALEQKVIPRLFEGRGAEDQVRVWVAGCATGEEAYSVAMLLAERAAGLAFTPDVQVFATDLDEQAVAQARNGYYTLNDVADVPPERLRQFFVKEGNGFRVRRELREMVLFAQHNLIKDPPFSHLDLVTCRNVLIYLNRKAQERTLEMLHFALKPSGYLMLGASESIDGVSDLFMTAFDKESHLYQSRAVKARMGMQSGEYILPLRVNTGVAPGPAPPRATEKPKSERLSALDLHQRLLEFYGPPSVLVNEEYEIIHASDRAGRYLHFPGGEPSRNLLRVVRPELSLELRAALLQAAQNRTSVKVRGLVVATGDGPEAVNILIRPALGEGDPARGFFLVLFEESHDTDAEGKEPAGEIVNKAEPAARRLAEENARLRAQMRATIEQYEVQTEELKAANEEQQAVNEELRSTSEELETSKEELQAVNEELHTVNQELKIKIEELSQANNDLRNLMTSSEIGAIFLDRALRIKLFTPRARDIFNLIPADVGRPLSHVTSQFAHDGLLAEAESVLERLHTVEREIETRDGRWYLMRLLPYRTAEDRIEGVVLTFVDITERKLAEEALRTNEKRMRGQKEAFQAAVNGATLADSLNILARMVTEETAGEARTAFYMANPDNTCLHTIRGAGDMPESYANQVDGFLIGEDSLACSLAVPTGRPVLTRDVFEEPLWEPWTHLAEENDYRGCWSFPIKTRDSKAVGIFAMYFRTPREAVPRDLELADIVTQSAAVIISSHTEAQERARAEEALRESRGKLARELEDTIQLQKVSSLLIEEEQGERLYEQILDAAMAIQHADFGSIQMLGAEEGELHLTAWRNFHPRSAEFWQVVSTESGTSCGAALHHGERVILPDVHAVDYLQNTEDQRQYDLSGITAVQSTPLTTREGRLVGMISTHWREAHTPGERELRLLDILARQAADFSERRRAQEALRESEERLRRLNEELEQRVYRRTLELGATNEQLQGEVQERRAAEEQVKHLLRQFVSAQEEERRRIARDLHDHLGQQMTALRLNLTLLDQSGPGDDWRARIAQSQAAAEKLDADVDSLAWQLRPVAIDQHGLVPAINYFVQDWSKHTGIAAELHTTGMEGVRLAADAEINLYRILQESLNNIAKHSRATNVSVLLERRGAEVALIVEDDGRGFDPEQQTDSDVGASGLGLIGMRERAQLAGGTAEIESSPGAGATVLVRVPVTRTYERDESG